MYVVFGVARDLERLRASNVLFITDPNGRPTIDQALGGKQSYTHDSTVVPAAAYARDF